MGWETSTSAFSRQATFAIDQTRKTSCNTKKHSQKEHTHGTQLNPLPVQEQTYEKKKNGIKTAKRKRNRFRSIGFRLLSVNWQRFCVAHFFCRAA